MGLQKPYGKRELEKILAECHVQPGDRIVVTGTECHPWIIFGGEADVQYVHPSYVHRGALLARVVFDGDFAFSLPVEWLTPKK